MTGETRRGRRGGKVLPVSEKERNLPVCLAQKGGFWYDTVECGSGWSRTVCVE